MNNKILLVKIITLLYKESTLDGKIQEYTRQLCKKILDNIKTLQVSVVDLDPNSEVIEALKDIAYSLIGDPAAEINLLTLQQNIMVAVRDEHYLYEGFIMVVEQSASEDDTRKTVITLKKELDFYLQRTDLARILKEHSQRANFEAQTIDDWRSFRDEVIGQMQTVGSFVARDEKHPALNMSVNFDNLDEIGEAFSRGVMNLSHEGVLKTGLQGVNEMCGRPGGFRRGEYILYSAPQYSFKSGFALLMIMHLLMYNTPQLIDPNKKPLMYFFSFENTVQANIVIMYRYLKENELGRVVTVNDGDFDLKTEEGRANLEEAKRYIKEKLSAKGFHFQMDSYNSTLFTTQDLLDKLASLEAEGYEVVFCLADYVAVLNKKGLTMGAHGDELRDQHRRIRSYTNPRGITFMTPHQMSQDAIQLLRDGKKDGLVKMVAGHNYYDGCKRIGQEPDLELHLYVVEMGDNRYLEIGRGKHRDINDTDPKKQYCVYKFMPWGTIPPDIDGPSQARRKVGGNSLDGANDEWFEMSGFDEAA